MHFLIEEIELSTFHIVTSPDVPGKSTFWTFYVLTFVRVFVFFLHPISHTPFRSHRYMGGFVLCYCQIRSHAPKSNTEPLKK